MSFNTRSSGEAGGLHQGIMTFRQGVATVTLYGIAHLLVDACCAAATFRTAAVAAVRPDTFLALLLLYHVVAFGLQAPLGLVVDAVRMPRAAAVVGGFLTIVALAMPSMPITTIAVVGIGNAIFHVAGGAICLRLAPHRAALPGVFVAPGSVGLLSGCLLGQLYPGGVAPLAFLTAAVCVAMAIWPVVSSERQLADDCPRPRQSASPGEIVLGLILLSVAVRSLLGFVVTFPWETRPGTLIALTAATCLGKALGGFAADRWGWRRVGVGAMLLALPLLAASSTVPEAAIPGLFLVNLTMPIGLIAVAECLPGRAGFAFGLTCLVLLLGMMPPMLGVPVGGAWALPAVMVSAASLYRGLGRPRWQPSFRQENTVLRQSYREPGENMRRIVAILLAAVCLSSAPLPAGRADPMPPGPRIPERKTPRKQEARQETVPLYAVAAGLTAVALTASLIALRVIRRKSPSSETPEDIGGKTPGADE